MCTTITVNSKQGSVMGRTMEFGADMNFQTLFIPRKARYAQDANGNDLISKYAVIGSNYFGINAYNDGVNEKGLMGDVNYFPQFAEYPKEPSADKKVSLAPEYLLTYLLTNFSTVAEVKEAIKEIELLDIPMAANGQTMTLHYAIYDRAGNRIVIEPVENTLKVYDNPVGVMTNSPDFDWHLKNLANYLQVQPTNRNTGRFSDLELTRFGEGTGTVGLPGDYTPASRFVRAAYFVAHAETSETAKEAVNQAFHILANFDIPYGAVYNPDLDGYDVTRYTAVVNSYDLSYNLSSKDDRVIRRVSLNELDLDSASIEMWPMSKEQTILPLF